MRDVLPRAAAPRAHGVHRCARSRRGPGPGATSQPVGHEDDADHAAGRGDGAHVGPRRGCTASGFIDCTPVWDAITGTRFADELVDLLAGRRACSGSRRGPSAAPPSARPPPGRSRRQPAVRASTPVSSGQKRILCCSARDASACPARSLGKRWASVSEATPRAASSSSRARRPACRPASRPGAEHVAALDGVDDRRLAGRQHRVQLGVASGPARSGRRRAPPGAPSRPSSAAGTPRRSASASCGRRR